MEKVDVIKITKEFEKEELVNAIKAYMVPRDSKFQLESVRMGETYIVRIIEKLKLFNKNMENCSVKLSFDEENCTVGISVHSDAATRGGIGGCIGIGITIPPLLPVALGATAVTGVQGANVARRFRSDILKIVKSFICGEEIIEEKPKKGKNLKKKEATAEDSMYVCSCGMKLEKNQKFCPECGKPREDSTWRCTCGQQIENSMKFCPYCGAAREQ